MVCEKHADVFIQVVSEEHDQSKLDLSKVEPPNLHLEEISHHTNFDEIVPVNELTVWVDPLDATQEYTGNYFTCDLIGMAFQ